VKIFRRQIRLFKLLLLLAKPNKAQQRDIDFLLSLGEIFTLAVYGQLILENAKIYTIDNDLIDQIFDFMVRDCSKFALRMYSKPSSTKRQMNFCSMMIKKPKVDEDRFNRVWEEYAYALKDQYNMSD
jgi:acyl-CoA dehydrogenase